MRSRDLSCLLLFVSRRLLIIDIIVPVYLLFLMLLRLNQAAGPPYADIVTWPGSMADQSAPEKLPSSSQSTLNKCKATGMQTRVVQAVSKLTDTFGSFPTVLYTASYSPILSRERERGFPLPARAQLKKYKTMLVLGMVRQNRLRSLPCSPSVPTPLRMSCSRLAPVMAG